MQVGTLIESMPQNCSRNGHVPLNAIRPRHDPIAADALNSRTFDQTPIFAMGGTRWPEYPSMMPYSAPSAILRSQSRVVNSRSTEEWAVRLLSDDIFPTNKVCHCITLMKLSSMAIAMKEGTILLHFRVLTCVTSLS